MKQFKKSDFISDALIDFAGLLGQQNDYEEMLRLITQKSSDMLDADITLIMMINPRTHHTLKTIISAGDVHEGKRYHSLHTSVSGWVIKHEKTLISPDIQSDPRFRKNAFQHIQVGSVLSTPLRSENRVFGTLSLFRNSDDPAFEEKDLSFLEKINAIVSPFVRNIQKIEPYFKRQIPEHALLRKYETHGLLGKSKLFITLLQAIECSAQSDVRVILEGKSGTGKELIARAIHNCSERSTHPFVAVDCGAIPAHLIESELFGHLKGAFTGASVQRKGLFEEANHGTLFMDEINNLPMDMQVKLLRVLQEGEIRPLGSNTTRKIDVRVITASSMSLKEMVNKSQFREDLFYRLLVFPIHVPSLEDRREDIPLLASHFLNLYCSQQNKKARCFDGALIEFMQHHQWNGNIRELENFTERMVTLATSDQIEIGLELLPAEFRDELNQIKTNQKKVKNKSLAEILNTHEMQVMRQALVDHEWNQSAAATALGIHESTLRYKMHKYGIQKSTKS